MDRIGRFFAEDLPARLRPGAPERPPRSVYEVEVRGQGTWTLDLTREARLFQGASGQAHCTISIDQADLIQALDDPRSLWTAFVSGRASVSDPCRAARLIDRIWPGVLAQTIPAPLFGALFTPGNTPAPSSCEQGGGGPVKHSYVRVKGGFRKVPYEETAGLAVFEGDIILGSASEMEGIRDAVEGRGTRGVEAYRIIDWSDPSKYVWPDNTLIYQIGTPLKSGHIRRQMQEISAQTNIQFVERTTEDDYVEFVRGDGCNSWVGKQGGRQEITLAIGCVGGVIVHEICHALGLWHEQSRLDRDAYVTINTKNIIDDKIHNFEQQSPNDSEDLCKYDYCSIMHYDQYAFAKRDDKGKYVGTTIDCKQPKYQDQIGQRKGLSDGDIKGLDDMYP